VSSTRKSNKRRLSKWQFTDNISCKFGNGKEIDFWRDKWLVNEPFCELFLYHHATKSD
jgi:hypothetical protein